MSKGGKGGGGGSAPKINVNPNLGGGNFSNIESATQDIGSYIASLIGPSASEANWASDIATGGNVTPFPGIPQGGQPYNESILQYGTGPSQTYPPLGEVSGSATPGSATGTSAGLATPGGGTTGYIAPTYASGTTAGATPGTVANTGPQTDKYGNPINWDWVAHDAGLSTSDVAQFIKEGYTPGQIAAQYGIAPSSLEGPLLQGATNALGTETQIASHIPPGVDPTSIGNLEKQFFGNANPANIPGGTLPASGLYPQQQALIDAQTKSAQAATAQAEANMGLTGSTQGAELAGEIGQQGAAEAGQLIQGNLQIAQNAQNIAQGWAKLGMGEQALGIGAQEQQFTQFAQIAQQYAGLQSQMWGEALQGQGIMGGFIQQLLGAYGLSTTQASAIMQAEAAQAQDQVSLETASMQQQAQGTSSLFSGLGALFGSGGSGGLFGGLLGGGAAAGGAAAAGTGAASSGEIAGILTSLLALA